MLLYPFVIQATFGFFEDKGDLPGSGLKRGLLIGAFINLVAGAARWLGAVPSVYGFAILSFGQVLAAIGNMSENQVVGRGGVSYAILLCSQRHINVSSFMSLFLFGA